MSSIKIAVQPPPFRGRGNIRKILPGRARAFLLAAAVLMASLMLLAMLSSTPASAHSKSSYSCGGNHWYGAYYHRGYNQYQPSYYNRIWETSLGGVGGSSFHSISYCV